MSNQYEPCPHCGQRHKVCEATEVEKAGLEFIPTEHVSATPITVVMRSWELAERTDPKVVFGPAFIDGIGIGDLTLLISGDIAEGSRLKSSDGKVTYVFEKP